MIIFPRTQTVAINRTLVGVIAIVLLVVAAGLWFITDGRNIWAGACLKIGSVMAALWLVLPANSKNSQWGRVSWKMLVGFFAIIVVLTGKRIDFRIVLVIAIAVAITLLVVRSKSK